MTGTSGGPGSTSIPVIRCAFPNVADGDTEPHFALKQVDQESDACVAIVCDEDRFEVLEAAFGDADAITGLQVRNAHFRVSQAVLDELDHRILDRQRIA